MKTERDLFSWMTFCWHCRKALAPKPGGGFYFELLEVHGHKTKVHKICLPDARESLRQRTAQQSKP